MSKRINACNLDLRPAAFKLAPVFLGPVEAWFAPAGLGGIFPGIAPFAQVANGKTARDLFLLAAGLKVMRVRFES